MQPFDLRIAEETIQPVKSNHNVIKGYLSTGLQAQIQLDLIEWMMFPLPKE